MLGRWLPRGEDCASRPARTSRTRRRRARSARWRRAGCGAFYRGRIAREIVRRVHAAGGILTMQDLADYQVARREPVQGERFGFRWASAPPPSAGGVTMLASLAFLERRVPDCLSARRTTRSCATRSPRAGRAPTRTATSTSAIRTTWTCRRWRCSSRAGPSARADVFHPTLAQATARYDLPLDRETRPARPGGDAGTSHLCVVDAEGNVASITTTVNLRLRRALHARRAS